MVYFMFLMTAALLGADGRVTACRTFKVLPGHMTRVHMLLCFYVTLSAAVPLLHNPNGPEHSFFSGVIPRQRCRLSLDRCVIVPSVLQYLRNASFLRYRMAIFGLRSAALQPVVRGTLVQLVQEARGWVHVPTDQM